LLTLLSLLLIFLLSVQHLNNNLLTKFSLDAQARVVITSYELKTLLVLSTMVPFGADFKFLLYHLGVFSESLLSDVRQMKQRLDELASSRESGISLTCKFRFLLTTNHLQSYMKMIFKCMTTEVLNYSFDACKKK
jgi:hypothetical protein